MDIQYGTNDYILFIGQESNFQSRSMLIPACEFMKVRGDDYLLLKTSSVAKTFTIDGVEYIVNNLLLQNVTWQGNSGTHDNHPFTKICSQLVNYANGMDEEYYCDLKDKKWYDLAITNFCNGFNHIKNHTLWKTKTMYKNKPINIVDSFLYLTMDDYKLSLPICDTVEEMLHMYYS